MRGAATHLLKYVLYIGIFANLLFYFFFLGLDKSLVVKFDWKYNNPQTTANTDLRLFGMDWWPPKVTITLPNRTTDFSPVEFTLKSDEPIQKPTLPSKWTFFDLGKSGKIYLYLLRIDDIASGKQSLEVDLADKLGNDITKQITLQGGNKIIKPPTWDKFAYTVDGDALLAIVNKTHKLPSDYAPSDLVSLSSLGINNVNAARMRRAAAEALRSMTSAIRAAGIDYTVTSGYRSYESQVSVYNFWLDYNKGNVSATDAVSARPGFSEHQLGNTLDFTTNANGNIFYQFEYTPLSKWLAQNAYKYGFAMSYPKGKEPITGYTYEPWHYRYIGKGNALDLRNSGLTLTEWLLKHQ